MKTLVGIIIGGALGVIVAALIATPAARDAYTPISYGPDNQARYVQGELVAADATSVTVSTPHPYNHIQLVQVRFTTTPDTRFGTNVLLTGDDRQHVVGVENEAYEQPAAGALVRVWYTTNSNGTLQATQLIHLSTRPL